MVPTRCFGAGVVALAVFLGHAAAARAEDPLALFDGRAELLAQAKMLFREGTAAYRKGQLDRARVLWLSAFRADRHHQIAGALGHVETALGRYRDAAEHLSFFLRETRDSSSLGPRDRALLEQDFALAQTKIGVLSVAVEPRLAEVLVDGSSVGKAPLLDPVFVDPGRHVVEARLDGYDAVVRAWESTPGSRTEITIQMSRTPKLVAAPLKPVPLRPAMPIEPTRGTLRDPVVITGAAVSVVGLGVGAALTGWWAGLGGSGACLRDKDPSPCEREWATVKTASVWTLSSAAITGAGTVAYALLARRRARVVRPGIASNSLALEW